MKKIKNFIRENIGFLAFLVILIVSVNIELPYYIEAPGGTINLSKRMDSDYDKNNGSLNMLYVTEYKGNIVTFLLGNIFKSWDVKEISNQQMSNETQEEIYTRNKVMLDNSIQNAIFVAYNHANKKITIKDTQNIVIGTTKENGIKIGDIILTVDNKDINDIVDVKKIVNDKNIGETVDILLIRDSKKKHVIVTIDEDHLIGVAMITNYEYTLPDNFKLNFKSTEGGSSGGLVLSLGIYSEITGIDILKGRNIAGTGTIDIDGNVGEIDGVKYKVAGAVKNHMDLILVSPYNYDEAIKVVKENNYDIKIVKVTTFKEAVEYLTK